MSGSRAEVPAKIEPVELDVQNNVYIENESSGTYDNEALQGESDSEDEKKDSVPTHAQGYLDQGPSNIKRTASRYINDQEAAATYTDVGDVSASESSNSENSTESEVSSMTSEDSDVDDDTFDYYKQHEAFKDIMATEQRDWHNEAMTIQKEYGKSFLRFISRMRLRPAMLLTSWLPRVYPWITNFLLRHELLE